VRIEAHLRDASPLHHKSYATLAPLITAGFAAFGGSEIYSEDRVRCICERFKKTSPHLAREAFRAGNELPIGSTRFPVDDLAHITIDDLLKRRKRRRL